MISFTIRDKSPQILNGLTQPQNIKYQEKQGYSVYINIMHQVVNSKLIFSTLTNKLKSRFCTCRIVYNTMS